MAEERQGTINSLKQLLFVLDLDLDYLQRTGARSIDVTGGVDVTVPWHMFIEFMNDVKSLLRRKYPDFKVFFFYVERGGNVNIRGYTIQDKVARDVHELIHLIINYMKNNEETDGWYNDVEVELDYEEYDDLLLYLRGLERQYGMKVELRTEEHDWFVRVVGFRTVRI